MSVAIVRSTMFMEKEGLKVVRYAVERKKISRCEVVEGRYGMEEKICPIMSGTHAKFSEWSLIPCQREKCALWVKGYALSNDLCVKVEGHCIFIEKKII